MKMTIYQIAILDVVICFWSILLCTITQKRHQNYVSQCGNVLTANISWYCTSIFVRRRTLLISKKFTVIVNMTQRTCSSPWNHYQPAIYGFSREFPMILSCRKLFFSPCFKFSSRLYWNGKNFFILKVSQNKWTFWGWFIDGLECVTCQMAHLKLCELLFDLGR